jgi:hypothetical protein
MPFSEQLPTVLCSLSSVAKFVACTKLCWLAYSPALKMVTCPSEMVVISQKIELFKYSVYFNIGVHFWPIIALSGVLCVKVHCHDAKSILPSRIQTWRLASF